MDEIPPRLDMLDPKRFNPEQQMRVIGYHMDALRLALGSGTFRPAVRQAQMLAEIIRLAAILEDREFRDHPVPMRIPPQSHSERTTGDST